MLKNNDLVRFKIESGGDTGPFIQEIAWNNLQLVENEGPSQVFRAKKVDPSGNVFMFEAPETTDNYLTLVSTPQAENAEVINGETMNSHFLLEEIQPDVYWVRSTVTQALLTRDGDSNGSPISFAPDNGTTRQKWKFAKAKSIEIKIPGKGSKGY